MGRSNGAEASSGCEIPVAEDIEMKLHRMFYKFADNNYIVDVFEMLSIPFVEPPNYDENCDREELSHILREIQSSLHQISMELRGLRHQMEINKINAHFNKCYELKTNLQLTRNQVDPLRGIFESDLREQCRNENPIGAFALLNRDTSAEMLAEIADYDNASYIKFKDSMKLNLAFCLLVLQQCHRVTKFSLDHHSRRSHYTALINEVKREINSLMDKFTYADWKSANNYGHIATGIVREQVLYPSVMVTVYVDVRPVVQKEKTEIAWSQLKKRQPQRAWSILCTPFNDRVSAFRFESINGIMRDAIYSRPRQTCLALSVRKGNLSEQLDNWISPYKGLNLTIVPGTGFSTFRPEFWSEILVKNKPKIFIFQFYFANERSFDTFLTRISDQISDQKVEELAPGFERIRAENDLPTTMEWLKEQVVVKNDHQHLVILVARHDAEAYLRYETSNFEELEMINDDGSISQRILIGWAN